MERLKRNIHAKADKLLDIFPVVVILGARQVGKTTLCKELRPDWKYFDLQNPQHRDLICSDPVGFFKNYPEKIILDEAQEVPEILQTLRGIVDQTREQKNRFLLTGSSSPNLIKHTSETLAGRVGLIPLGTLKANERFGYDLSPLYKVITNKLDPHELVSQDNHKITREQMLSSWLHGGYPEPTIEYNPDTYKQWMENYFATYINTDITRLFPRLQRHVYQRFLKMIGHLTGNIVNKNQLARSLEVNEKTVSQYIQIAEGTYLWRSLLSYNPNTSKSLIKMPKGYLRDSGLLHYLLRIYTLDDLYNNPISGTSFESFVVEEIISGLSATTETNWQAYYYRTKHGMEVDLILEGDFGIIPIEVKQSASTRLKQLSSLKRFVVENNLPLGILINQSDEITWLDSKILQIPFTYL